MACSGVRPGCSRRAGALDALTPPFGRQTTRSSPASRTRSLRRLAMSLRHPSATARTDFTVLKDVGSSVRAILNHGNVPQDACMALLRVRGAFI